MIRSTDRILTTHVGSLPRPDDLIQIMFAKEEGNPVFHWRLIAEDSVYTSFEQLPSSFEDPRNALKAIRARVFDE